MCGISALLSLVLLCYLPILTALNIPDYLVIGQQKCGTSTLYEYIKRNPNILVHKEKELLWWSSDNTLTSCDRSVEQYLRFFDSFNKTGKVLGEFSTAYFSCYCCAQVIRTINPAMKIIVMLREPVSRSLSRYLEQKLRKTAPFYIRANIFQTFETYVADDIQGIRGCLSVTREMEDNKDLISWQTQQCYGRSTVVGYSAYDVFLKNWLALFPPEQLLVIYTSEFAEAPLNTLRAIEKFLGVPPFEYDSSLFKLRFNGLGCYGWHEKCPSTASNARAQEAVNSTDIVAFLQPHMKEFKRIATEILKKPPPRNMFENFGPSLQDKEI